MAKNKAPYIGQQKKGVGHARGNDSYDYDDRRTERRYETVMAGGYGFGDC